MWSWLFIWVFLNSIGLSIFAACFLVWALTLLHRGFSFRIAHCALWFFLIELLWNLMYPYTWVGFVHNTTTTKHPLFGKKNSLKTNTNTLMHQYFIFNLFKFKNLTFGHFFQLCRFWNNCSELKYTIKEGSTMALILVSLVLAWGSPALVVWCFRDTVHLVLGLMLSHDYIVIYLF